MPEKLKMSLIKIFTTILTLLKDKLDAQSTFRTMGFVSSEFTKAFQMKTIQVMEQ